MSFFIPFCELELVAIGGYNNNQIYSNELLDT